MTSRSLSLPILAAAVTTLAASAPALAVHKNWVLRNAGGQCAFTAPSNDIDRHTNGTFNGASYARFASCPVSLSGRWGSSTNPNFSPPLSAAAMAANVYVVNKVAGEEFYCTARARMGSGSQLGALYYSRTAIRTAGGDGLISVAYGSDWAGTMETNQSLTLRSLDLECRIPPNYSGVYAYKVRICQTDSSCHADGQADGESLVRFDTDFGWDFVQTSGIECVTDNNTSNRAQRSENGMKNTDSTSTVGIYCPISQAADDSLEGLRHVSEVFVHYSGGSGAPSCQLVWRDRYPSVTGVTTEAWSRLFIVSPFGPSAVTMPESLGIVARWDVSTVVFCDVRPGQTIKGITAKMTVADVTSAE